MYYSCRRLGVTDVRIEGTAWESFRRIHAARQNTYAMLYLRQGIYIGRFRKRYSAYIYDAIVEAR